MLMTLRAAIAGLALSALLLPGAAAYDLEYEAKPAAELIDQDVSYSDDIPLPEDVTGFRVGERIYSPDMLYAYMRAVAAASDRVTVDEIGRAHSGRPILRATVTSPENHERLDDIRAAQTAMSEGEAAPDGQPVVVQFTHGVHGTEPSGYDSVPLLLYFLAAGQGAEVEDMLDRAVINIIAPLNPDGVARFAEWTGSYRGAVPVADPQHREHVADWPSGRVNKYFFDLNRQWLALTQPEIRSLVEATLDWMPNVVADFHEMGENTTYFFSPGPHDQLHPLLGTGGLDLTLRMNEFLIEQLDSEGALHVSGELFDDYYLGYGSSYPGLLGAVPYLFEQSSVRGIVQETDHGILWHDDKTGQQARVGLALIRAALANSDRLHAHQRDFYEEAGRLAAGGPARTYVFTSHDRGRLADFIDILQAHRIEVRELRQATRLDGNEYRPGESYVVTANQRQYRVIEAMFERQDTGEMTEFYDVSGWTLPLAFGMDWSEVRSGLFSPNLAGDVIESFDIAAPAPERSEYGYVIDWSSSFYAPRAVYRLSHAGMRMQVIPDTVELRTQGGEEVTVTHGGIVATVRNQSIDADAIHALMVRAAEEDGVTVHPVSSAATLSGSDLGGFSLTPVRQPRLLLVSGPGTAQNEVGELWHLLDHEMRMPVTLIDVNSFSSSDISGYTHIILASGQYSGLGDDAADRLKAWTRQGGTLIGVRGGASWAVERGIASASMTRTRREGEDADEPGTAEPLAYEDLSTWDSEHSVAGAIFAGSLDVTHPLGFGYRRAALPLHRIGEDAFVPGPSPVSMPLRYSNSGPLLSGYASDRAQEELRGHGVIFAERSGRGSVILFADNPYFRAYFRGPTRTFMNAIFFSNAFRNASRTGD
jgi:hypothetical protein